MKFDRNTVLGLVILAALFIGFFVVTSKQQAEARKELAGQSYPLREPPQKSFLTRWNHLQRFESQSIALD